MAAIILEADFHPCHLCLWKYLYYKKELNFLYYSKDLLQAWHFLTNNFNLEQLCCCTASRGSSNSAFSKSCSWIAHNFQVLLLIINFLVVWAARFIFSYLKCKANLCHGYSELWALLYIKLKQIEGKFPFSSTDFGDILRNALYLIPDLLSHKKSLHMQTLSLHDC